MHAEKYYTHKTVDSGSLGQSPTGSAVLHVVTQEGELKPLSQASIFPHTATSVRQAWPDEALTQQTDIESKRIQRRRRPNSPHRCILRISQHQHDLMIQQNSRRLALEATASQPLRKQQHLRGAHHQSPFWSGPGYGPLGRVAHPREGVEGCSDRNVREKRGGRVMTGGGRSAGRARSVAVSAASQQRQDRQPRGRARHSAEFVSGVAL